MAKYRKRGAPVTLDWIKSNCIVDEDTGCWIWQLSLNPDGYGKIKSQGKRHGAHRMAFQLAGGIIPPGLNVLHSCDRPNCCNPAHLAAGTQFQNIRDMHAKGREQRGEKHGNAKLTDEKVRLIRTSPGILVEKAKMFGVSTTAISRIMRGEAWAHVT